MPKPNHDQLNNFRHVFGKRVLLLKRIHWSFCINLYSTLNCELQKTNVNVWEEGLTRDCPLCSVERCYYDFTFCVFLKIIQFWNDYFINTSRRPNNEYFLVAIVHSKFRRSSTEILLIFSAHLKILDVCSFEWLAHGVSATTGSRNHGPIFLKIDSRDLFVYHILRQYHPLVGI